MSVPEFLEKQGIASSLAVVRILYILLSMYGLIYFSIFSCVTQARKSFTVASLEKILKRLLSENSLHNLTHSLSSSARYPEASADWNGERHSDNLK
ncbi:MAG TPA: hypothetical protein DDW27_05955 [Bacteroidales bacterium]|nr:hypothetical protein [Bacteroidales bacterium]